MPHSRQQRNWNWFRDEESGSSRGQGSQNQRREMSSQRSGQQMQGQNQGRSQQGQGLMQSMASMPFSPLSPIVHFYQDVDRIFDQVFRNFGMPLMTPMVSGLQNMQQMLPGTMFRPSVDIAANENEYVVCVEVPGLDEQDVQLQVSPDGTLMISGEKRQENSRNQQDFQYMERSYGSFQRSISLPQDADMEGIEAEFRNGLLTIVAPRMEKERQQMRQIPIGGENAGQGQRSRREQQGQNRSQGREQREGREAQEREGQEQGRAGNANQAGPKRAA